MLWSILHLSYSSQARRQDLAAGGATFFKYSIGCMQQSGENVKWGAPILNGGTGTTAPPAGDSPWQ